MKNFNLKEIGYLMGVVLIAGIGCFTASAQSTDSLVVPPKLEKELKNIIKFNVTNWLIYDNSFQFSYERLLKKNRSINIFGGYQEFPLSLSLNLDRVDLSKSLDKSGYVLGADYRFYLKKENKYPAPRGVFLAPYVSFIHFNNDRTLNYNDENGDIIDSTNLNTQINIFNVGASLGYQFIIQKRFVIDAIVFGPAVSSYVFKARLKSDIEGLDSGDVSQEVIDAIKEKFPFLDRVASGKEATKSGTEAFWSGGFRYSISVGYRF